MASAHKDAPLDIRFFKVNAGPVALIVDWIADRATGLLRYRASLYEKEGGALVVETTPMAVPGPILTDETARGAVGGVEFDLTLDIGADRVAPHLFPVTALKVLDMTIESAPAAVFDGWIRHRGREYACRGAPGAVSHYWGRRLPREWWWVSCSAFDVPGVAVESTALRSGLWGLDVGVPMGYLYLRLPGGEPTTLIAPPAIHWAGGDRDAFEVRFRRLLGEPISLICRGRGWRDWNDRIWNTLVGDMEIRVGEKLVARASGTAGLERRFPPAADDKEKEPLS